MNCGEFKVRVSHGSRANPSTQHPNKNGCANSANLFGYVLFTAWIMPLIHSLCVSYWNSSLPCRLSTVVSLSHHTLSCGGSVISLQYREKLAEGRGYQIYTWKLGKRELDSDWEWSRWHLSTGFTLALFISCACVPPPPFPLIRIFKPLVDYFSVVSTLF